jgi:hypothetical protein
MKQVRFVKPFVYADVVAVDMVDTYVTINASSNVEGYLNDDIFLALDAQGLVIDITPAP